MSKPSRIRRVFLLCVVAPLALYGASQATWIPSRLIAFALSSSSNALASAYYECQVKNRTAETLMVSVEHINDLPFRPFEGRFGRFRERIGYVRGRDFLLKPNESNTVILPSHTDPRLGLLLVSARTERDTTGRQPKQKVGLYLLSWPWKNGIHMWRDETTVSGWPARQIEIENEHLVQIDGENFLGKEGDPFAQLNIPLIRAGQTE